MQSLKQTADLLCCLQTELNYSLGDPDWRELQHVAYAIQIIRHRHELSADDARQFGDQRLKFTAKNQVGL